MLKCINNMLLYFGPNGLSQSMKDEPNREDEEFNLLYQEWQSSEPHDQDDAYEIWLHNEPKRKTIND